MATIGSGTPLLYVEGSAVQTGGSGNQRTVKITAKFKVNGGSSSWYSYACNWRARVNNSYGSWAAIKGTESWNGGNALRTFEQTLTVDVGTTSSKAITVGIYTDSQIDNGWDGSYTWSLTVGATNVAPSNPGAITIRRDNSSGSALSGTIPENINTFYVSWGAATDANKDTIYYDLQEQRNGGSWASIDGNGTDLDHQFHTTGGEGTSYRYRVQARDNKGGYSDWVYSGTITKNTLTGGWFTTHSNNIGYNDGNQTFTLYFTGGKNTDGTTPKYMVYSDTVTVYNQREVTTGSETITIFKTGTAPSTPYIRWTDLVNVYKNSGFTGNLHVGLRTGNGRGTYKWVGGAVGVDMRTAPNPPTSVTISGGTAWKTTSRGNYYVPTSGADKVNISWAGGGDKLGQTWKYALYKIINGQSNYIGEVSSSTTSYSLQVPIPSGAKSTVAFGVHVVTSFGYSSFKNSSAHDLHWYSAPTFSFGTPTRTATEANVKYSDSVNTSIPGAATTISWASSGGNRTVDTSAKNVKLTGLSENSSYTITATVNDNTGLTSNRGVSVSVGANQPVFFINKYGVGVGGFKAESSYSLNVKGNGIVDNLKIRTAGAVDLNTNNRDKFWVSRTGNSAANRPGDHYTVFNIGADNNSNFQLAHYYGNSSALYVRGGHDTSGNYTPWARVYTTQYKPSAADVGAPTTTNAVMGVNGSGSNKASDAKYIYKSGFYDCHNMVNSPFSDWTWLINSAHINNKGDCRYGLQIAGQNNTNNFAMRTTDVNGDGRWNILYHTGNKPTASDVGAVAKSGDTMSGQLNINDGSLGILKLGTNGNRMYAKSTGTDQKLFVEGGIYSNGTITGASDRDLKENIVYLDDMPIPLTLNNSTKFKDFIKDFKFASFNYIGSDIRNFGFIAQDIAGSPVGDLMLNESTDSNGETTLAFGLADYTSIVARALQEEIKSRDEEIKAMHERVKKLEDKLNEILFKIDEIPIIEL